MTTVDNSIPVYNSNGDGETAKTIDTKELIRRWSKAVEGKDADRCEFIYKGKKYVVTSVDIAIEEKR